MIWGSGRPTGSKWLQWAGGSSRQPKGVGFEPQRGHYGVFLLHLCLGFEGISIHTFLCDLKKRIWSFNSKAFVATSDCFCHRFRLCWKKINFPKTPRRIPSFELFWHLTDTFCINRPSYILLRRRHALRKFCRLISFWHENSIEKFNSKQLLFSEGLNVVDKADWIRFKDSACGTHCHITWSNQIRNDISINWIQVSNARAMANRTKDGRNRTVEWVTADSLTISKNRKW